MKIKRESWNAPTLAQASSLTSKRDHSRDIEPVLSNLPKQAQSHPSEKSLSPNSTRLNLRREAHP